MALFHSQTQGHYHKGCFCPYAVSAKISCAISCFSLNANLHTGCGATYFPFAANTVKLKFCFGGGGGGGGGIFGNYPFDLLLFVCLFVL